MMLFRSQTVHALLGVDRTIVFPFSDGWTSRQKPRPDDGPQAVKMAGENAWWKDRTGRFTGCATKPAYPDSNQLSRVLVGSWRKDHRTVPQTVSMQHYRPFTDRDGQATRATSGTNFID